MLGVGTLGAGLTSPAGTEPQPERAPTLAVRGTRRTDAKACDGAFRSGWCPLPPALIGRSYKRQLLFNVRRAAGAHNEQGPELPRGHPELPRDGSRFWYIALDVAVLRTIIFKII